MKFYCWLTVQNQFGNYKSIKGYLKHNCLVLAPEFIEMYSL